MAHQRNYDKYKHLIGTELNGWKILDIKIYEDKRHTYALAQCHCGNVTEVRLTHITTGRAIDCGCGYRDRLKDIIYKRHGYLVGATINNWTILKLIPPETSNEHTFATCRCKCGTERDVRLSYVVNGRSKDCGCGRKSMLRETRTKNLVGQRFGKLVVLELLEESNSFNRRMYRCKCDCGNEAIVASHSLRAGHTHSCGCLSSYANMRIHQYFEKHGINHQTEYSVRINGHCYRFDFYLPDHNLMIEYDGEQHFHPVPFGGDQDEAAVDLRNTKDRDAIKTAYCVDNNINLLRIPYWENKNIETLISNHLQRLSEEDSAA